MKNKSLETVTVSASVDRAAVMARQGNCASSAPDVADIINADRIHIFELGLEVAYRKISQVHNPYGDGRTTQRTAKIVSQFR